MENSGRSLLKLFFFIIFILISDLTPQALSESDECAAEANNSCNNKTKALSLKIIGIASILITSMIGVCLPLVTRSVPALSPDRSLFIIVKAFASGIILATGFMHVLPDSFDMLSSTCLKDNPWHKFPFTGFVAMLSAIVTLAIDSMATSLYAKKQNTGVIPETAHVVPEEDREMGVVSGRNTFQFHSHQHGPVAVGKDGADGSKLLRYRVIAMVSTV